MAILNEPVIHNSNIEEGRRSSSRSSSRDSDSSPRARAALLDPDSGDEAEAPAKASGVVVASESEGPIVRPPVVPLWGGGAFSKLTQRSTSSPFHRQVPAHSSNPERIAGQSSNPNSPSGLKSVPGHRAGDNTADASSSNASASRSTATAQDDSRKPSIPSLLISAATSLSPVPTSLHDFASPVSTNPSQTYILSEATALPAKAGPSFRCFEPSPPPSEPANRQPLPPTQSGTPVRGRGAKRGTKPGAKRGEWRVKNYAGSNTSATGEQIQPVDSSTYSSFFKVVPPRPEPDYPPPMHDGNEHPQIASSSNLRLQVPSESPHGTQHGSRSASSREHSTDGDDYTSGTSDYTHYQPPPSPQPSVDSQVPNPLTRLVAIILEDKRYGSNDLQLVEINVPVRPSSTGELWLDAEEVCDALQKGPSRIDGPAKVYTYRGKFRQYFLRVSFDNRDTYGPAHLRVSDKRVLRAFVEQDVPPRQAPMDHAGPSNSANVYGNPGPHQSGYLVSPATPGPSDYSRSPVDYNYAPRGALKRQYEYSTSSYSGLPAAPSPPIPSSLTAPKKPRRQPTAER